MGKSIKNKNRKSKICTHCSKRKKLELFSKCSYGDGTLSYCKKCAAVLWKDYYERKKDEVNKKNRAWHKADPERERIYKQKDYYKHQKKRNKVAKQYYQDHKKERLDYVNQYRKDNVEKLKDYREKNRDHRLKAHKEWRKSNVQHIKAYYQKEEVKKRQCEHARKYQKKNPEKVKEWARLSSARSRATVQGFLKHALRNRLLQGVKGKHKSSSAEKLLGCTYEEVRVYLESLFLKGMTWNNHGLYRKNKKTWQIDHIIPVSSFDLTKASEQRKCFHFSNLQPLWAEDNIKKSNKLLV